MKAHRIVSSVGTIMSENFASAEIINSGRSDNQFFHETFHQQNTQRIMHGRQIFLNIIILMGTVHISLRHQ